MQSRATILLVALVGAAIVLFPYMMLRTHDDGPFGFSPRVYLLGAGLIGMVLLGPIALGYLLIASWRGLFVDRRACRRMQKVRCVQCGYNIGFESPCCPECGSEPRAYAPSVAQTERRFMRLLAALAVGTYLGGGLAEAYVLADEARFRREAAAHAASGHTISLHRQRAWPAESWLTFDPTGAHQPPNHGFFTR